jgi:hypothetical protein
MIKRKWVGSEGIKFVLIFIIPFFFLPCNSFSQNEVSVYPRNWWVGMKWNKVQIMLHGDSIGKANSFAIDYPGVLLKKINRVENKNYVSLITNK